MELNGSINDDVDVNNESSRSLADTRGVQLELQGHNQSAGDGNSNKQTPFAPKNGATA